MPTRFLNQLWHLLPGVKARARADICDPLVIDEVNALIRYASEKGIDPAGPNPALPDQTTLVLLTQAVHDYDTADSSTKAVKQAEVLRYYARLVKATKIDSYEINGRTLLDTRDANIYISQIVLLTVILLAAAIGNEMLASWLSEQVTPEEGWPLTLANFHEHVLLHLMPFVWGGLGACVYLSKSLYDFAQFRAFDRTRLHGIYLRVVIGAVLAAVVLYLFDPAALSEEALPLDYKAVAFLVGLGVKVVYGALEKLVNVLVEKFDLGALRQAPATRNDVLTFLSEELSDPTSGADPKRKAMVVELMQKHEQATKAGS